MNEFHVLAIICSGALVETGRFVRSWRQAVTATTLCLAALLPPWLLASPDEVAFMVPVGWFVTYGVLFSLVFHNQMTPRISPAGVLHHVVAASCAVAATWPYSETPMPLWLAGALSLPAVGIALVMGAGRFTAHKVGSLGYLAFLLSFVIFMLTGNPLDVIGDAYLATGFSLQLGVAAFLTGSALVVVINIGVQVMLAFDPRAGALLNSIFQAALGPSYENEQRQLLASCIRNIGIDVTGWLLIAMHALAAILAVAAGFSPAAIVGPSVLAWVWWLESWEGRRGRRT